MTQLDDIESIDEYGRVWVTQRFADENGTIVFENTFRKED